MHDLLSVGTYVESPFIIVKIGNYTFGNATKTGNNKYMKVTFPNYMQSIEITKINGSVNTYTIKMVYPIVPGDDPNMLDKVFGSVSDTRKITISYGDWNAPSYIYKEEEALITDVQSSVDFSSPRISYTISCVSASFPVEARVFNFPARTDKPSAVIKELVNNSMYGLKDVFKGMVQNTSVVRTNLIASDDMAVHLDAQPCSNVVDYLNYLVSSMKGYNDNSIYQLVFVDDNKNGSYFTVSKISSNVQTSTLTDSYSIDIGFPGNNFVTSFSIKDTSEWPLLYNYSKELQQEEYTYKISNLGTLEKDKSVSVTRNRNLLKTTNEDENWWKAVTEFPISASLTIKGLVRPTTLMSYVKLNCVFYGRKHISSGLYVITKQVDTIDNSGYRTVLDLLRVRGDL